MLCGTPSYDYWEKTKFAHPAFKWCFAKYLKMCHYLPYHFWRLSYRLTHVWEAVVTDALNSWINPYHPQGINNELLSQTNTKIINLKGKIRKDKLWPTIMQKNNLHLTKIAQIMVICILYHRDQFLSRKQNKWSFVPFVPMFSCAYFCGFSSSEPYAYEPSSLVYHPPCKKRDVKLKYENHKRFGATLCT
jgi:hypothetical protein